MKKLIGAVLCLFLCLLGLYNYYSVDSIDDPVITDVHKEYYTDEDIASLQHTEIFADGALEHIFYGNVNSRGAGSGYHYDRVENTPGEIIEGTRTEEDRFGVYTAKVRVNGADKTGNHGYSSFYPDRMSPQEVVDAINQAYANRQKVRGTLYAGLSDEGMEIDMALDDDGLVITAYPVKEE
ncbi:MAG: EndoU domain-containing protein [Solobacterium sp.]|nr:EndoU domain-containing protein [Solobacterium sp.]